MTDETTRREAAEKLRKQTEQEYLANTYSVENIAESVAVGLEGGVSREEMVDRLVDAGADPETAAAFFDEQGFGLVQR